MRGLYAIIRKCLGLKDKLESKKYAQEYTMHFGPDSKPISKEPEEKIPYKELFKEEQ